MYTKENRLIGKRENLSNYVEGNDIYNSAFLHHISDPDIVKIPYQITINEYRPDMIAKDFYGSEDYLGILMVQIGSGFDQLTKGTILYLIPKDTIDAIIRGL